MNSLWSFIIMTVYSYLHKKYMAEIIKIKYISEAIETSIYTHKDNSEIVHIMIFLTKNLIKNMN